MSSLSIDRNVFTDLSWWHWALTIPLLAAHLSGVAWALEAAVLLCVAVGDYFLLRIGKLRPYPVQLRLAYLALLLIGAVPGMRWILWVQLIGTTAMITVGYCALGRTLNLMPFNREEPLSGSLIWRTFCVDPCAGGILRWTAEGDEAPNACCSLPTRSTGAVCSLHDFEANTHRRKIHAATH